MGYKNVTHERGWFHPFISGWCTFTKHGLHFCNPQTMWASPFLSLVTEKHPQNTGYIFITHKQGAIRSFLSLTAEMPPLKHGLQKCNPCFSYRYLISNLFPIIIKWHTIRRYEGASGPKWLVADRWWSTKPKAHISEICASFAECFFYSHKMYYFCVYLR